VQAFQAGKNAWIGAFGVIAVLFGALAVAGMMNPEQPAMRLGGWFGILLVVASFAAFAASLTAWKPVQLRSIPSITDRNPESLAL
jgi:quinol-cytochrome oxidoreductase complex cytochrome b subunit